MLAGIVTVLKSDNPNILVRGMETQVAGAGYHVLKAGKPVKVDSASGVIIQRQPETGPPDYSTVFARRDWIIAEKS